MRIRGLERKERRWGRGRWWRGVRGREGLEAGGGGRVRVGVGVGVAVLVIVLVVGLGVPAGCVAISLDTISGDDMSAVESSSVSELN